MKIALAVQHDLVKENSSSDDWLIKKELEKHGIEVEIINWQDNSIELGKYNSIFVSSTWNAALHCDEFIEWLERCEVGRKRLINDKDVLLFGFNKNKYLSLLIEQFGEIDSYLGSIAPSLFIKPGDNFASLLKERAENQLQGDLWQGDMVIKPIVSAMSKDTYLITRRPGLLKRFNNVYRPFEDMAAIVHALLKKNGSRGLIVQPFISSVEESGEYQLIFIKNQFSHAIVKPKGFDNRSSAGKKEVRSDKLPEGMLDFARRIMQFYATKFPDGITRARLDFFIGAKGPILCETEIVEPHTNIRHLSKVKQKEVISRYAQALVERMKELNILNSIQKNLATTDLKQYYQMLKNPNVVKAVMRICQVNQEILKHLSLSGASNKLGTAKRYAPIYVKECLNAIHVFSQRNYQDKDILIKTLNQVKYKYVSHVLGSDRSEFSKGVRLALMAVVNFIAALSFGLAHYVHYKQNGVALFFSRTASESYLQKEHLTLESEIIESEFVVEAINSAA